MFKHTFLAGLLILITGAHAADFQDLSFLSGCWQAVDAEATSQECWGSPLGALLLGTSKTVVQGHAVSFEFLRITDTESGVVYTPFVNGSEAVSFRLVAATAHSAVFGNPEHDFPKQIRYERTGQVLSVTLSGDDESGRPMELSYAFQRVSQ